MENNFFQNRILDKSVPIHLYFQLKELIIEAIKSGEYKNGSLIPTEKEFSEIYQISRTTVRQAVTELVQEGWLYRVKSKGTFVSTPKINQDFIQRLETYQEQMERSGMTPETEVLALEVMEASGTVAKALQLEEGQKVIYLHRRRFADGEPILTAETYLPYELCKFVLDHDFEKESLYETLRQSVEAEVLCVHRRVEAVEATAKDVQYLDMKLGKPIQLFHSVGSNAYGRPIEYSVARYRGDRNSFEVTVLAESKNRG